MVSLRNDIIAPVQSVVICDGEECWCYCKLTYWYGNVIGKQPLLFALFIMFFKQKDTFHLV